MKCKGPNTVKILLKQNKVGGRLALLNFNTWFKDISIETVWLCGFWHKIDKYAIGRDIEREGEREGGTEGGDTHASLTDFSFMSEMKMSGKEWP